jgi:KamA family protein
MVQLREDDIFQEFEKLAKQEGLMSVKVTPHYRRLVEEEIVALQGAFGPLYRVAYPTRELIGVRAPDEVRDFVQDQDNMPPDLEDVAIRKYKDRLLVLITDRCAGHCMYCFRQDVLVGQHVRTLPAFVTRVSKVVHYLQSHPEVREVILSGGDPLCVPFGRLEDFLRSIREETSVNDIRVHTRNVVYAPEVFTERVCDLLGSYDVRLVLHVVHPYELGVAARRAIGRAQSHGVRCYCQFPVLRGINDHPRVLEQLLYELDDMRVRPLTLFIADPINYSAAFRVSLTRLFSIVDDLNWHTPAWINAVRLVLDTPVGKVRREDIVRWDKDRGLVTFERDGKPVVYPDLPEELDVPGDIATLLWRSRDKVEMTAPKSLSVSAVLSSTKVEKPMLTMDTGS